MTNSHIPSIKTISLIVYLCMTLYTVSCVYHITALSHSFAITCWAVGEQRRHLKTIASRETSCWKRQGLTQHMKSQLFPPNLDIVFKITKAAGFYTYKVKSNAADKPAEHCWVWFLTTPLLSSHGALIFSLFLPAALLFKESRISACILSKLALVRNVKILNRNVLFEMFMSTEILLCSSKSYVLSKLCVCHTVTVSTWSMDVFEKR